MSPLSENARIPNPLRSTSIPPELLSDIADKRIREGETLGPFAFITTKRHPTLPLEIHNYTYRAFWPSSPLSSYTSQKQQEIMDSQTVPSDQNEASLALTLASRALVTEISTGRVISRSFSKFFNSDEPMAYRPTGDEYVYEIQEKVDGSIISLFWYDGLQTSSGTSPNQGQWVVASRTSFSSQQTESAWNILNTKFSSLINTRDSSLDKTKTYVFELVDNRMPIKIRYPYELDLVLLSIFGIDGSESREVTRLPFRRPKTWKLQELLGAGAGVTTSSLKQLSKLERANEEGFVITFWRTQDDMYPQRLKVKFDSYLKLSKLGAATGTPPKRLSKGTRFNATIEMNGPPSPLGLLNIYTSFRMAIPSFNKIDACMSSVLKQRLLGAIRDLEISDDYGGEAWLAKITTIWDRIHALSSIHEAEWKNMVKKLEGEGFKSDPQGKNTTTMKQNFDKRIRGRDVDRSLLPSLKAWFEGKNIQEIVKLVVENAEYPSDLKSTEIIVLGD